LNEDYSADWIVNLKRRTRRDETTRTAQPHVGLTQPTSDTYAASPYSLPTFLFLYVSSSVSSVYERRFALSAASLAPISPVTAADWRLCQAVEFLPAFRLALHAVRPRGRSSDVGESGFN